MSPGEGRARRKVRFQRICGWQRSHTSKTYASVVAYNNGTGTALKTLTLTYDKDSGLSYTSNLRPSNVQITDGSYTRRTGYTYTTINGVALPADMVEYNKLPSKINLVF
ncbi:MAG: hypothetical protein ACREYF_18570 [Gammaproteobacteria bacterium]